MASRTKELPKRMKMKMTESVEISSSARGRSVSPLGGRASSAKKGSSVRIWKVEEVVKFWSNSVSVSKPKLVVSVRKDSSVVGFIFGCYLMEHLALEIH